jgi:hypothetical protein
MQDLAPGPVGQIRRTQNDGYIASMERSTGSRTGIYACNAASGTRKTSLQHMIRYRLSDAKNGRNVPSADQVRRAAVKLELRRTAV